MPVSVAGGPETTKPAAPPAPVINLGLNLD